MEADDAETADKTLAEEGEVKLFPESWCASNLAIII